MLPSDSSLIWYHTFFVKGGKLVHNEKDADLELNGVWCHNRGSKTIRNKMIEVAGSTILDAGTCSGFFSCLFEDMGAISYSSDTHDRAQRRSIKKELSQEDRFIHENIYHLHKREDIVEPFDYVWCQDVFCHLENPIFGLRNLRSVCGKKIFIATDRFDCTIKEGKTHFQAAWKDVNEQSICHYHNNIYTYSYSESFLKQILTDCGFINPNKKFSYFTYAGKRNPDLVEGNDLHCVGNPTIDEMKNTGRWIDVYEATVNPASPKFPPT